VNHSGRSVPALLHALVHASRGTTQSAKRFEIKFRVLLGDGTQQVRFDFKAYKRLLSRLEGAFIPEE
jgi:hypothetical protein